MTPSDSTTDARLTAEGLHQALQEEFARLNQAHFDGRLTCPEIIVSKRKTYGGYYMPRRHRIVVSWQAYLEHGWPETLNTFRHEVAHILHPNHSQAFWTLAHALGATQRYASAPAVPPAARYIYQCPSCGKRLHRQRRLRANTSCGACDKHYNPAFQLVLVQAETQK